MGENTLFVEIYLMQSNRKFEWILCITWEDSIAIHNQEFTSGLFSYVISLQFRHLGIVPSFSFKENVINLGNIKTVRFSACPFAILLTTV